jgi:hypothetical protein
VDTDNTEAITESKTDETIRLKPVDNSSLTHHDAQKSQVKILPEMAEPSAKATEPFKPKFADTILLAAFGLIGIVAIGFTRLFRPLTTTITRWAKANPGKAQGLIAGSHLSLLGLGLVNGYNLNQMGYEVSDALLYGLCGATAVGFMSTPLMPTPRVITIPKQVNRQRLGYAVITLSSLMLMVGFGNRIEKNHPGTPFHETVQTIDRALFTSDNTNPDKDPKASLRLLQDRKTKAGISVGAAIGLTVLLLSAVCAGICLIAGLFGATGPGYVIGGLLLLGVSIWGLVEVSKARKARKNEEAQKQ